jgi:hypothetical protein
MALTLAACDNGETITAPTPNPTVTETFTGSVTRNGSQLHAFVATAAGTVTATITAVDPADSPAFGFSMGTLDLITGVCTAVLTNRTATTSAVLTGNVVGITSLCVQLFDSSGTIPADVPVNYTLTVQHP